MSYLIDQRRLIFLRKMYYSDNLVLKTLSSLKYNLFIAIGSKYDISAYDTPIKTAVFGTLLNQHYILFWRDICIDVLDVFLDVRTVFFVTFTVYCICVFILLPSGVINDWLIMVLEQSDCQVSEKRLPVG